MQKVPMGIPKAEGSDPKQTWAWHVDCEAKWFAGPFKNEPAARKFIAHFFDINSCPGCGNPTPDSNDYDVGQM